MEDLLSFGFQSSAHSIIKVIGVGGGGSNAVNHMFRNGIVGVDFVVCNTDAQALKDSPVAIKVQLGAALTEGRGAGNVPKKGELAAIESLGEIRDILEADTKMVFITAGMGGGTGTGAAPIIAQLARELDILTIAVVTIPSRKEGMRRYDQAMEGIQKLDRYVDCMLVISNENLHKVYGELPAREAFAMADNIVCTAVKGCAEIITLHGNINIDFADVDTVMRNSGVFIMGTGLAEGPDRAYLAVEDALRSPLLDSNSIYGTGNILLNIISGEDEVRMGEIGQIIDYLQQAAGDHANIIWGNGNDPSLGNQISITIIATGFVQNTNAEGFNPPQAERVVVEKVQPLAKVTPEPPMERMEAEKETPPTKISYLDEFPDEEMTPPVEKTTTQASTPVTPPPASKGAKKQDRVSGWLNRQLEGLFSDDDGEIR
ncbi:MAG: cell division protein FtsZ [Marinilabiliales bacterium]|nr:cell division protein FtsZ [Marinilabiliales bacterium]